MEEARASWNTVYQSKEGFECQITIRDEDEASIAERAQKVMAALAKAGAAPLRRWNYVPAENATVAGEEANNKNAKSQRAEKTYFDEEGIRRCNRKLKSGEVCGQQVTEREGRYGPFWSCPNYKEHAA